MTPAEADAEICSGRKDLDRGDCGWGQGVRAWLRGTFSAEVDPLGIFYLVGGGETRK